MAIRCWPVAEAQQIDVVGMLGADMFATGERAVRDADVVIGDQRLLSKVSTFAKATNPLRLPLSAGLDTIETHLADQRRVCVLASGDPGFFGITRALAARFGTHRIRVHPAPSSISLAFGRIGLPWDDALVISAHGRSFDETVSAATAAVKLAVLTGPAMAPERVGQRLIDAGCSPRRVVVFSRIGEDDEATSETDLPGLAAGTFDPLSVVVLLADSDPGFASAPLQRWGGPECAFAHRAGMITKSEVRAVVLAKLQLPATGVLWDVGAGSGSVAIDAAHLSPALRTFAIEQHAEDAARIRTNTSQHGVATETVNKMAPDAFTALPDPDRIFIGGGGLDVLAAARARLRPDGIVVATFASLDRAAAAARLLGNVVQINVGRGVPIGPEGDVRLAAENPVFICWGNAHE